jgi:hypothetical protein
LDFRNFLDDLYKLSDHKPDEKQTYFTVEAAALLTIEHLEKLIKLIG